MTLFELRRMQRIHASDRSRTTSARNAAAEVRLGVVAVQKFPARPRIGTDLNSCSRYYSARSGHPGLAETVRATSPSSFSKCSGTKFGIELLAVYTYPAQVMFCAKPFSGLGDLSGRRIRTSSVGQSEMMTALGAMPVLVPFAEVVNAVRTGVVDCAITGTLSGNEIGLSNVTSYIYPMAISWGLSFFGANTKAWEALPPDLRAMLREALSDLERQVWDASDRETADGLACDIGAANCSSGHRPSQMVLVPVTPEDEAKRKRLLVELVLPGWIQRCGADCVTAWNQELAPALGIEAPEN